MRIEPIGAIGSVGSVSPIYPVQSVQSIDPAVLEARIRAAKQATLYKAIDAQTSNSHLATYLNLAGRRYNYYPEYGEYWLKERKSKQFDTVVSHIFTKHGHWVSVAAMLIKKFTPEEKEQLLPHVLKLNREALGGSEVYFRFGIFGYPDDLLAAVYGFPSTDVSRLNSLNQQLEIPMNTYFEEEKGISDCLSAINTQIEDNKVL